MGTWCWENQISGIIPESIGNLVNLKILVLNHNQISGIIPGSIENLSRLISLVHNNQISGSIPESFGNLVYTYKFSFANNNSTGSIPETFQKLTSSNINLSENYFFDCNFEPGPDWKMENYNKPNPRTKSAMKIVTTNKRQPFDGEKPKEKKVKLKETQEN